MLVALRRLPRIRRDRCTIYAMGRDGSFPLEDKIRTWGARRPDELKKLVAVLNFFARTGEIRNEQKVRHLGRSIFEFKTTSLRVFWFWDEGRVVVCTDGLKKQGQKTPKGAIDRAVAWRKDYFRAKAEGNITVTESP